MKRFCRLFIVSCFDDQSNVVHSCGCLLWLRIVDCIDESIQFRCWLFSVLLY
jgi:hypothetical protein